MKNQTVTKCPLKSCSRTWRSLEKSKDEKIRFCGDCEKNVHYTEELTEFVHLANEGKCVAYFDDGKESFVGGIGFIYGDEKDKTEL